MFNKILSSFIVLCCTCSATFANFEICENSYSGDGFSASLFVNQYLNAWASNDGYVLRSIFARGLNNSDCYIYDPMLPDYSNAADVYDCATVAQDYTSQSNNNIMENLATGEWRVVIDENESSVVNVYGTSLCVASSVVGESSVGDVIAESDMYTNDELIVGDKCLCKRTSPVLTSGWIFVNQSLLDNVLSTTVSNNNEKCLARCARVCASYFANENNDLDDVPALTENICEDINITVELDLYRNYNNDDNTIINTVNAGYSVSMPIYDNNSFMLIPPTREGYQFNGYFSARSGGVKYYNPDMSSARVSDMTANGGLYAQWTPNVISLSWLTEGGTTTGSCTIDGEISLPTAPTRIGYDFAGWHVKEFHNCLEIPDVTNCTNNASRGCAWINDACHVSCNAATLESWCDANESCVWDSFNNICSLGN